MSTIHDILAEYASSARHTRDKGDRFERLVAGYLRTEPLYQSKFSDVWLWQDWPERGNRPDTGIDIVARERDTGDYCAIQCKFYDRTHTIQRQDIDPFFTASGQSPFKSRMIVSTTDKWSVHAENALREQSIPVSRLRVQDLAESAIDWSRFSLERPDEFRLRTKKALRQHQQKALRAVEKGFASSDRGKLIMACGTGKTFTSLKIAEKLVPESGLVLFLVPSISLLSQTVKEWTIEASVPLRSYAVCSDVKVGERKVSEDISVHDLAFPATTNARSLVTHVNANFAGKPLTVIFSTYQSIQVLSDAQKMGLPDFDLIICDEAHRTTGVTLADAEESAFVRVHDNDFIRAKKRLYMTATPRIYSDASKVQAEEGGAELCSMDNPKQYGEEFHRLGFGEAVGSGLLSDYKVMVLAVDEKFVSKAFQGQIADSNNELTLDDAVKIIGCWNGLAKRMVKQPDGDGVGPDTSPMRRAVAFARSIKDSKKITSMFTEITNQYRLGFGGDDSLLVCEVDHVDGTFNALKRNERLDWLKEDASGQGNICRILSNARCLSEGVDVPALDAVMFLNPRDSVVDVVQSVGRVMRKTEGKRYGYIILPIGIPADVPADEALKNNKKYRVVWQVLQALRAHDDRFNAIVNKIELNKATPDTIQVIGVGGGDPREPEGVTQYEFDFPHIGEWRDAIFARIVQKCGDRRYWETWASDVAQIAERHTTRIKALVEASGTDHRAKFDEFVAGLRENLNPSISENDAIEMLSQHLITKPVFDALFEGYSFAEHNPVSISMQKMLDVLEGQALEKETTKLDKFYDSVRERAKGIDNAEGKQKVIVELYDKFFRAAFPRMAERLGIVYTPIEIVDFIVRSVEVALKKEFGASIGDRGVHVLDPFTGTGTFMVRLIQSGLIKAADLERKYHNELHANELVLLAYYIAAINIEEAFHGVVGGDYSPFDGIVLTDTFQLAEADGALADVMFPENNRRATRQRKTDIRVIFGNPPYSVGQDSANDANQNIDYPKLDAAIEKSYAAKSSAALKRNLYDSYVRAFRWASDRVRGDGIVCFVSNGSYVEKNTFDGFRASLEAEFSAVYCFNLRGDARTSGERRRREKGNVFGEGTRTPVAITLLVKKSDKPAGCVIHYHDVGDYLSEEEKLDAVESFGSIDGVPWVQIKPNTTHDWLDQRDPAFGKFTPIGDRDAPQSAIFAMYSLGVVTSRDAWACRFSRSALGSSMASMIEFYNEQVSKYRAATTDVSRDKWPDVDKVVSSDAKRISWSRGLKNQVRQLKTHSFSDASMVQTVYRPFCRQWLYFDRAFNETVSQVPKLFPTPESANRVIAVVGPGARQPFAALMVDAIPDLHLAPDGAQCFPLFVYEKGSDRGQELFEGGESAACAPKSALSDGALAAFVKRYGAVSKEDVFYYVYGVLHSPDYRKRFAADLKKQLPRIPYAKDFWIFSKAGRELGEWHVNYETVEPYPLRETQSQLVLQPGEHYRVSKMVFGKKGKDTDKSVIVYNSHVTLSGIPLDAYEYVVNGRSAIDWIMERYQVTTDPASGIKNDPNDWSDDPTYIVNLLKRIVRVSVETNRIVSALPPLEEQD